MKELLHHIYGICLDPAGWMPRCISEFCPNLVDIAVLEKQDGAAIHRAADADKHFVCAIVAECVAVKTAMIEISIV